MPKRAKGCAAITMGLDDKQNKKFNEIEEKLLGPQEESKEEPVQQQT